MPGVFSTLRPLKRLKTKTCTQEAWVVEVVEDEHADAKKKVYLVTLPHPRAEAALGDRPLRAPAEFTRQQIAECVLDACVNPAADQLWAARHPGQLPSGTPVQCLTTTCMWSAGLVPRASRDGAFGAYPALTH